MAGTTLQTGARATGASPHRLRRALIGLLGVALAVTPVAATLTMGQETAEAAPGDPGEPVVIGITGDYGWNHPSYLLELRDFMQSLDPDYVVTTGDNVQTTITEEEGSEGEDGVRDPLTGTDIYDFTVGRAFCGYLAGAVAGSRCPTGGTANDGAAIPSPLNRFYPAPGNHDHMGPNGGGPISNYTEYFNLPGIGATSTAPSDSELFYDVVMGDVHLFVLDSDPMLLEVLHEPEDGEINIPGYGPGVSPSAVQRAWLEGALASSEAAWKVVAMHHSPYSSAPVDMRAGYGSAEWVQWPFAEWGVDAVVSGHHHAYERVELDGVQYVTNGLGGDDAPRPFATPIDGSVARFSEATTVVGRLSATETELTYQARSFEGNIVDTFSLNKTTEPVAIDPFGSLDALTVAPAGQVRVTGWAADPSDPTAQIKVRVTIGGPDGTPGITTHLPTANLPRAGVDAAHPGYGNNHGFDATITTGKRGNVPVCAYAVNVGPGADQLLGCSTASVYEPKPVGHFQLAVSERSGQVYVRGWAIDRSAPTTPVTMEIVIGGQRGTRGAETHMVSARWNRADVARANPGTGSNHGFDPTLMTDKTGEQTVCVYAKNIGLGSDTLLGCKQVDIVK